ncbi:MAG TPA: hypothetical protein VLL05_01790 [Terriglobales bacterium]|nr:hypothetical protein [Terriglobales bacterium]
MSVSISTLLTRNLYDVFGENDAARRRVAIAEKLPRVHGMSPSEPGAPRLKKHGKIVLRVA